MVNTKNFLAVLERLASVFAMEEYERERVQRVLPDDTLVEIKDGSFSWGFRVKENQAEAKKGKERGKVLVEDLAGSIIDNVNFSLKKNDHMIIVGKVG